MGPRAVLRQLAARRFQAHRDGSSVLASRCPRGVGRQATPHPSPPSRAPRGRGTVVEREQPRGVRGRAFDGVHLPGRGALVLGKSRELPVRPAGRASLRTPRPRPFAGLVPDLPPRLHVGHPRVVGAHPAVDGRGRQPQVRVRRRDLLGREPLPYGVELERGRRPRLVDAAPAPPELLVGCALRHATSSVPRSSLSGPRGAVVSGLSIRVALSLRDAQLNFEIDARVWVATSV